METLTLTINVGLDDNGIVQWADCTDEVLTRKALAFIHNERVQKKEEERRNAKTCRNCKFAIIERRFGALAPQTCQCSLKTHGKYNQWHKQMRLSQSCELFERLIVDLE